MRTMMMKVRLAVAVNTEKSIRAGFVSDHPKSRPE